MSLKSTALKLGLAFAAVKGVQAFRDSGGLDGVKRKLGEAQAGRSGTGTGTGTGTGDDPIAGMLSKFGVSGGAGGMRGLLGGLAGATSGPDAAPKVEGLLARTRAESGGKDDNETEAGLIIRAMVMAVKADGEIDAAERRVLNQIVSDGDPEDIGYLDTALDAPVDPVGLAGQVPKGQEMDVYTASVMAITPDNRAEAEHLDKLAKALGLAEADVNELHADLGKPPLY